jgi:hypothetical protein
MTDLHDFPAHFWTSLIGNGDGYHLIEWIMNNHTPLFHILCSCEFMGVKGVEVQIDEAMSHS